MMLNIRKFNHRVIARKIQTVVKSRTALAELNGPAVQQTFPSFVMSKFKENSNLVAVVDGSNNKELTYGEIEKDTFNFAASLQKFGIKHKDCVALMSPNHLHYFSVFTGIALSGAYSTCLNPMYGEDEIKHQLNITGSKTVIAHALCLDRVVAATAAIPGITVIAMDDTGAPTKEYPGRNILKLSDFMRDAVIDRETMLGGKKAPAFDPDQILTLPFSSGTTGVAKGVMLSHKNLLSNLLQMMPYETKHLGKQSDGTRGALVCPLPFFHIYGLVGGLFSPLFMGGKTVFMPAFDLIRFLEIVPQHKVTRAYLVPPIILALAKHPIVAKYDLSSLKCIMSGAAPLGSEIQMACADRLKCVVKQAWGMTELSPAGTITPDDTFSTPEGVKKYKGTSGQLLPGTEAKIVDPLTRKEITPTQEGELLLRGPQVMRGYLNNAEATKDTITPDGWLCTGDIAHFDNDGFLYLTDRLKELIKYKGFQVPPAELEALIDSMDEVKDCVVIPVPDDEAGEVPRAYVVKQDGCPAAFCENDVVKFVEGRVAPHKRLRGGVIFTTAIPKSPSGKLLRRVQIDLDRKSSKK
jgi:acyl-CoA synthetase (AMP-forming)/AMP-acid ligase II